MDFQNVLSSINLTTPSWDLFVLIIFAVGIGFYLLSLGKDRAFVILLSSYIAFALMSRLELLEKVAGVDLENSFMNQTVLYLALIGALFLILSRSAFTAALSSGAAGGWFQTLVVSFLQIGLVLSVIVSFLPQAEANNLSIFLKSVFVEDGSQAFWFVTPLLAIFLLKEK